MRLPLVALLALTFASNAAALNPLKRFTQYTHRKWTQAEGLPQDTVRAIVQSSDGYLWIGTDEGLARFDGYRFVVFSRGPGQLPSSAITALCAASDGTLWIGTASGLTSYRAGKFTTYGPSQGLVSSLITAITEAPDHSIWVATGLDPMRFHNGRFISYKAAGAGIQGVRAILSEPGGTIWAAGYGTVGRIVGDRLVPEAAGGLMSDNVVTGMVRDSAGELIVTGTQGLFVRDTRGQWRRYTTADGLPDTIVRSAAEDRDRTLWIGTNGGLARRHGSSFVDLGAQVLRPHEWVWCIFEDHDGSLWVGTNNGLHQFLDQPFTVYTSVEGLPSDQPIAVHEDQARRLWVGFHDSGLGYFEGTRFVSVSGMPSAEVFCIRETRRGELLVGSRGGLTRVVNGRVAETIEPRDSVGRHNVFDALEDSRGRLWAATNQGLLEIDGNSIRSRAVPGGTLLNDAIVVAVETRDGAIWAGTYAQGLWRWNDGQRKLYTPADGLPNEQVRSLYEDSAGVLWIGTFGGGLAAYKDGKFYRYTSEDGLPSDNIARILDDQRGSLWLGTTRGVVRISRRDLDNVFAGTAKKIAPVLYGIAEGLRSAQCAPGFPTAAGGARAADSRLWFPTGFGLAVVDPREARTSRRAPPASVRELLVDGRPIELDGNIKLPPGTRRVEFRYSAIELGAPESIRYRYQLEGIDRDWIHAETRRVADYTNLRYGHHRFTVAATEDGMSFGPPAVLDLYREPHLYETWTFRIASLIALALAIWGVYQLRLQQVRRSFALVLEERARIAREIHDTLAQGFVGIATQLEAVAMMLKNKPELASKHLDLARRMAQHSLTEARRSIMDLRAEALDDENLDAALRATAKYMTAGTNVQTEVSAEPVETALPRDVEHQLVRITQEAIANAVKHGAATRVRVELARSNGDVLLRIADNGSGFDPGDAFVTAGGHFGLLGMRERAQRIGGKLKLDTSPGGGTTIEVSVPLP